MNILYISSSRNVDQPYQDSSVRYRCFNPAQALSAARVTADVTTIDRVSLHVIERYDLITFHRPVMGKKLERLVNRAKQRRCAVLADYDDLIFNPEYAHQSPGVLNQQHLLSTVIASFKRRYDALCLFDHFSVSTTPLAAEIRKIRTGSDINVLHNNLSDVWLKHARRLSSRKSEVRRITYLPGTNSHHHDFSVVQDIFSGFLADNPDAVLRIVGSLRFKKEKFNGRQLELVRYVPYPLLPGLIRDSWVTIAPLANTLFNNCKSGLKYFESAAFGVPVIASPIDDMQRLSSEALRLADTPEQWLNALHLLSDKTYYEQCSVSGINHVKKHCVMSHHPYREAFARYV
jgi:glycosyltransferase involved in cell wall biosynthesis